MCRFLADILTTASAEFSHSKDNAGYRTKYRRVTEGEGWLRFRVTIRSFISKKVNFVGEAIYSVGAKAWQNYEEVSMPPPENLFWSLNLWVMTPKTYWVRGPPVVSIRLSFGWNPFSGLGAINFTTRVVQRGPGRADPSKNSAPRCPLNEVYDKA